MAGSFAGKVSRSDTKNIGYVNEQSVQTGTDTTAETQLSETQQTSLQEATTSSLDLETQKLIKDLIGDLGADILGSQDNLMQELSSVITERAKTSEEQIMAAIEPIVADARLQGEQQLKALETQLAQQSGGSVANTLVASSTAVGRANLESQLAKTESEMVLAGREAATAELAQALTGAQTAQKQPIENISNLLNILKGANIQQTQVAEQATATESELSRILESIAETSSTEQHVDRTRTVAGQFSYGFGNQ